MAAEAASLVGELLRCLGVRSVAPDRARVALRARLTTTPPGQIPDEAWPLLDALWALEARGRLVTDGSALPRVATDGWLSRVSLWRGDITTLQVSAIVNAANSGLTGCYQPMHACVDNAIHTAAGPWLREACGEAMATRGRPEPTATATLTRGYYLPAHYVLHTVGPIVESGRPTDDDARLLARCYTACLEAAAPVADARSVAFCSISTGVFGYPPSLAAPVAIEAVRGVLERDARIEQVIFVAYTAADQAVYESCLREVQYGSQGQ